MIDRIVHFPIFKLAEFSMATEIRKTGIINEFLYPKHPLRAYHTKAKNCIIQCLENFYDMSIIDKGLNYVTKTVYKKYWEKENSIKSLENFKNSILPFGDNFTFEKNENRKDIEVNGHSIYVNPEMIIKDIRDGIIYLGAIKIHISKTTQDKIDFDFCRTIVFEYLKSIAKDGEKVDFKMIYFYTPLNNKWNNSNSMLHTQIIENTIDEFYSYLNKLSAA